MAVIAKKHTTAAPTEDKRGAKTRGTPACNYDIVESHRLFLPAPSTRWPQPTGFELFQQIVGLLPERAPNKKPR
jgi:hypothetical protein